MAIVLKEDCSLEGRGHEDVPLVQKVCLELVLRVVPEPGQLPPSMLHLIIPLEAVVCREDLLRDCELVCGRMKWPEVRAEDHDTETDLIVIGVGLLDASLELLSEVLTQTHICHPSSAQERQS